MYLWKRLESHSVGHVCAEDVSSTLSQTLKHSLHAGRPVPPFASPATSSNGLVVSPSLYYLARLRVFTTRPEGQAVVVFSEWNEWPRPGTRHSLVAATLARRACLERAKDDVSDALTTESVGLRGRTSVSHLTSHDVPATDRRDGGRGEQTTLGDLDVERRQAPCVERDVFADHRSHALHRVSV